MFIDVWFDVFVYFLCSLLIDGDLIFVVIVVGWFVGVEDYGIWLCCDILYVFLVIGEMVVIFGFFIELGVGLCFYCV